MAKFAPIKENAMSLVKLCLNRPVSCIFDYKKVALQSLYCLPQVEVWKKQYPDDRFYCQARQVNEKNEETSTFIFVCQTSSQIGMLQRYGEICLMDATYKTMRYAMPLFFLCVRTNVNYEIVAAFIIQNETTAEMEKALSIIRDWNKNWTPNYFMCDCDEKEINAIETTFVDHDCIFVIIGIITKQAIAYTKRIKINKDKILESAHSCLNCFYSVNSS